MSNVHRAMAIEEVVKLPDDLVAFAKDPKFQQISYKIRVQTSIDSIAFDPSLQAVVIKVLPSSFLFLVHLLILIYSPRHPMQIQHQLLES